LDNELAFNEAIIDEREQGIHEIQQQIGEVNEIFKDLAVLVHEQGTMIDDIGSHIESSHAATAQGKAQLVKAAKTQRSNSSLLCLLLVIFGIVLLIVIIVLAA
jgi:syntaxin 7